MSTYAGNARSTYVQRFMEAESLGLIQQWYYSYSPENTLADRRFLFRDANGNERRLTYRQVSSFLTGLGV